MSAPPRPPYWVCSPRTPTCRAYHPYLSIRESAHGSVVDYRGAAGWMLYTCGRCHTHAFGVQDPHNEILAMYAISDEQLERLRTTPRTTMAWVILEYLGYMSAVDAAAERKAGDATHPDRRSLA